MNNLVKELKILSFKVIFQGLKLVESFQKKILLRLIIFVWMKAKYPDRRPSLFAEFMNQPRFTHTDEKIMINLCILMHLTIKNKRIAA